MLLTAAGSAVGRLFSQAPDRPGRESHPARAKRGERDERGWAPPRLAHLCDGRNRLEVEAKAAAEGAKIHVAVDSVGGALLGDVADLLAEGSGTVVNFGSLGGEASDIRLFAPRALTLKGVVLGQWLQQPADVRQAGYRPRATARARISVAVRGRGELPAIADRRRCRPRGPARPERRGSFRLLQRAGGRIMKFGTIGAGAVALGFAREALRAGHQVVLSNTRGPDSLANLVAELGNGASAATAAEAASLDYVPLAVPWPNVKEALRGLPAWNGRVLIDATNPFSAYTPKLVLADLGDKGASEMVAALAPGARVVKAFNSIVVERFNEGPAKDGGRRVIFLSGNHASLGRIREEPDRELWFLHLFILAAS